MNVLIVDDEPKAREELIRLLGGQEGYTVLEPSATNGEEALALIDQWTRAGEAKSVALIGNAAEVFPEILRRMQAGEALPNGRPDIVTDQTSAHDPLHGYLPLGWSVAEWRARQETDPKAVEKAARAAMKTHVAAMVDFWNAGVPTVDYGNNIRQVAQEDLQKFEFLYLL